jgi:hypothetical protein
MTNHRLYRPAAPLRQLHGRPADGTATRGGVGNARGNGRLQVTIERAFIAHGPVVSGWRKMAHGRERTDSTGQAANHHGRHPVLKWHFGT